MKGSGPRVLFIASSFPPANRPGSPRTWNIAQALAGQGWQVTVLTVEPSQWVRQERRDEIEKALANGGIRRIVVRHPWPSLTGGMLRSRSPHLAKRIMRKVAVTLQIDIEGAWVRAAARVARNARPDEFDLVYVSAPPFAALASAKAIAEHLRIPYAVDYRDLWTLNPMMKRRSAERHQRTDAEVIAGAAAVTVVSPSLAELLRGVPNAASKVHVLPNGYRSEDLEHVEAMEFDHFAIVYAGAFYHPKRSIRPIFEALTLIDRRSAISIPWRFHYFGQQGAYVEAVAAETGLPMSRLSLHGDVPRNVALAAVAGAGLVTVVTTVEREGTLAERGVVTGKIFEAIGLDRPVLVNAPRGSDVEEIVAKAARGRVINGPDTEAIVEYIAGVAHGTSLQPGADAEAYEWTRIGQHLGSILRSALQEQAG